MNNIALLISTYDNSEDLWIPLEQTYLQYWKDIDFPIYLSTNHKVFNSQLFTSLTIGNELSWSDNLIKSLNKINQEYTKNGRACKSERKASFSALHYSN